MAVSLIQTKQASNSGYVQTFNFAYTSNITAGSLLILVTCAGNLDVTPTVTDNVNAGNWSLAINKVGNSRQTWIFYRTNAAAGATTVTVTYGSGFPDTAWIAREWGGIVTASPLDQTASATSGASTITDHDCGTTAATANAVELVVGAVGVENGADPTYSAGTGYTDATSQKGFDAFTYIGTEDKITAATGTQNPHMTTVSSVKDACCTATFKAIVSTGNEVFNGSNVMQPSQHWNPSWIQVMRRFIKRKSGILIPEYMIGRRVC